MSVLLPLDDAFYRTRYRLVYLERVAYWCGQVGRGNLMEEFQISGVQASADLQQYLKLNPGALGYDLKRKRYVWSAGVRPVLHEPDFEAALAAFLDEDAVAGRMGGGRVLRLRYPQRVVPDGLLLEAFRAVANGWVLRVRYGSVNSGSVGERRLLPTGFGHDGFRWHVRAFCFKNGDYRDFVLGRLEVLETEMPTKKGGALPRDADWEEMTEVRMRLNPRLPEEVREILREDFSPDGDDVLRWPVRRALAFYAERYLKALAHPVDGPTGEMMAWFVDAG